MALKHLFFFLKNPLIFGYEYDIINVRCPPPLRLAELTLLAFIACRALAKAAVSSPRLVRASSYNKHISLRFKYLYCRIFSKLNGKYLVCEGKIMNDADSLRNRKLSEKIVNMDGSPKFNKHNVILLEPEKTCCFTGHRPEKLPKDEDEFTGLREITKDKITELIGKNVDTFITGMSRGFDLLAAEILVRDFALKSPFDHKELRLFCSIPYMYQFDEMKTQEERLIYTEAMVCSENIFCFYLEKNDECYKVRNQFMVNYSDFLIGYLRNEKAKRTGSAMTYNMAKKAGKNVYITYENDLKQKG